MTPADLLHSLVAVYPPEGSNLERSGALKGDRRSLSAQLPDMIKAGANFSMPCKAFRDATLISGSKLLLMFGLQTVQSADCQCFACAVQDTDFFEQFDTDGDGYALPYLSCLARLGALPACQGAHLMLSSMKAAKVATPCRYICYGEYLLILTFLAIPLEVRNVLGAKMQRYNIDNNILSKSCH